MYIDLLTRIQNAQRARHEFLKAPFSDMDFAVAELLARRGFIASVSKKGRLPKRVLEIQLKYPGGKDAIRGVRLISKPSLKRHMGYRDIRPIRQGTGMLVVSTPAGIMPGEDARKQKVGGMVLFEIW